MRERQRTKVRQSEDAHRCLHRARRSGGGEADPGPATISTITSVVRTGVFVCSKFTKKLIGSSIVWLILML